MPLSAVLPSLLYHQTSTLKDRQLLGLVLVTDPKTCYY